MAATQHAGNPTLEREFAYYKDHQSDLDAKYEGNFIVIQEQDVSGPYRTQTEALSEALKKYKPGTFLIQLCGKNQQPVQYFHSRVSF